MNIWWRSLISAFLGIWIVIAPRQAISEEVPVIAAASNLQHALTEIARIFKDQTGKDVKLTFGSSGNFVRQIKEGAPFEILFSADESFIFDIADDGLTADRGEIYAIGRIVIIAPHSSPVKVDSSLEGLKAALANGDITRFSIANPEHAPYGRRAEEALKHAGLWESLKDKLVLGENISQAAQFAMSGSSQGGIIAYSLALAPEIGKHGNFALIPEDWHSPLRQRMVLMKTAGATATAFFAFMRSPAARVIMDRYGFLLPSEAS